MRYQKFQADQLFTGQALLPGNFVLITNEAGEVVDVLDEILAGGDVQVLNGLLCPGFVNTHCHLELSHLKGVIPENTGLIDFLIQVPKLREYPAEVITAAMEKAAAAMWQAGIVAVGDISNTTDSISVKQNSPLQWHNFIECLGFSNEKAAERFAFSQQVYTLFEAVMPGCNTLVPHAAYSVSEALFKLLNIAAAGKISSIHCQESEAENEWFRQKSGPLEKLYQAFDIDTSSFSPTGKNSFASFLPRMSSPEKLLLVHNVAFDRNDLTVLPLQVGRPQLFFVLCANANRYIQQQLPPVQLLREYHCPLTLGTDSLASNHQLSILAEITTLQTAFPDIPLAEMLQWATLNGAVALGMEDRLGSFEKGKQPGVLLLDMAHKDGAAVKRLV